VTDEIPDPRCAVDGCTDPAIARLFGGAVEPDKRGPRCRGCLAFDLGLRDAR
jgi:hypothetical protein